MAVLLGLTLFMYQETYPQKKRNKAVKANLESTRPTAPEISYTISMSKPWTHLLEVEMRVKSSALPEKSEIIMPVWTPGSYLIREFARHVQDFSAFDSNGNSLIWSKANKNTWQISTKGIGEFIARYNVYANELTVRTNELNDQHAFWNNTALLMFPKDQLNAPSILKVVPFGNWKIATGLPRVANQPDTFQAPNFDVLYDSPFEVGNFKEITFEVQGKPHRFVVNGEGNYDLEKIAKETAKIIEQSFKIFGELPYDDYTFILNLRGGGGLEHSNSTALQWNRFGFKPENRFVDFMTLVAHEFFHLFNVKRIRPDSLGPFNYQNENYTKLLWVAEGATAYYENVLAQRAGLMSDKDFLSARAAAIQALQSRPGRLQTSLEEASFDAWVKYYRQDENAVNNQISYYDKGEIVVFLLDLEIRAATNGAKSLDDVFRLLYRDFFKQNKNYTSEDFQRIAETVATKSLNEFFSKYVRGREELNYNSAFDAFGLKLFTGEGAEAAYFGADLNQDGDRLLIKTIPAGSPAYNQGLNTGDQIIAVDSFRANQTFLQSYIGEKKPGEKIKLTIFRFDQIREIEIALGGLPPRNFAIRVVEKPSDEQKRLYAGFFGTELK